MRKLNLLVGFIIFITLSGCFPDNDLPRVENITNGSKWILQIGSSPVAVYSQLQELSIDKNFYDVAIVYRKPYSSPGEIQSDISLYSAITLKTDSGRIERILLQFDQDKISSIEKGGAMLESISKWPENVSDEISINVNDPLDNLKERLIEIYEIPTYDKYQIILPNKTLGKPYDPDMDNYEEWAFSFSENISTGRDGRNNVRLYFQNGKLVKIRNEYEEFEMVN